MDRLPVAVTTSVWDATAYQPTPGLESATHPIREQLARVAAEVAQAGAPGGGAPAGPASSLLAESSATLTRNPGKLLRPALLLLCSLAGPRGRAALLEGVSPEVARRLRAAAAAFELLHLASLVHDDIIDRSPLRRGLRTVWGRWGTEVAVLAGDHLYGRAVSLAAQAGGVVCRSLARSVAALTDGQTLEFEARGRPVGLRAYRAVVTGKTAFLCSEVCGTGARLGGATGGVTRALRRFGLELGRAYQAADDLLDWQGDPGRTGKGARWDLRQDSLNLPVLIGLRRRPARIGRLLDAISRAGPARTSPTRQADENTGLLVDHLARELAECGAMAECAHRVRRYTEAAAAALERVPPGIARCSLETTARALVDRPC